MSMIISHEHKYICIGIPRTASKSMDHWLSDYFGGRAHFGHHSYDIPDEYADYLVFTVVRNPYDRHASGHFAVMWDGLAPTDEEMGHCRNKHESLRKFRAILRSRERAVQNDWPRQSPVPLEHRIRELTRRNEEAGPGINQKRFVDRGRVNLVLYFERLPGCLTELPFVGSGDMPPFPYCPERGIRPEGTFFDYFRDTDEEQVVWAYAREDFEAFGYRRFECGLPDDAPNALRIG